FPQQRRVCRGGLLKPDVAEEIRSVGVVVGQRDADQSRAEDEDKEAGFGEKLPRIEHEESPQIDGFPFCRRRSVRQEKGEKTEEDGAPGGEVENLQAGGPAEESDGETGDDPAYRSPDANFRELKP